MIAELVEDFTTIENCLWHAVQNEPGREALVRIEARLGQLLDENEALTERIGELVGSALAQRVREVEAQLGTVRELVERAGRALNG